MNGKVLKRYFGMTLVQWVVLGCMGLFLCGLLGGMGWWLVRSNQDGPALPALAAPPTAAATPLAVPSALPSASPTDAPLPTATFAPTATILPRESLIPPGWVEMDAGSVEIWLPPGYVGGDLMGNRETTIRALAALGPEYGPVVETVRAAPANVLICGVDTAENPYTIVTSVLVSFEPAPVVDLDAYVETWTAGLPLEYVIMEKRRFITVGGFPVYQVSVQSGQGGNTVMHQLYMLLDGETVWHVEYSSHVNLYYTLQPTFEQSFLTFWINR